MESGADASRLTVKVTHPEQVSWGNPNHLAPELQLAMKLFTGDPLVLDFTHQASFALGVLVGEMVLGEHPIEDYPQRLVWKGLRTLGQLSDLSIIVD